MINIDEVYMNFAVNIFIPLNQSDYSKNQKYLVLKKYSSIPPSFFAFQMKFATQLPVKFSLKITESSYDQTLDIMHPQPSSLLFTIREPSV